MRPVFCGNFEYETRQSDLDRLFSKYGRVERVDIKNGLRASILSLHQLKGFAFVYFDHERDAEAAIRGLDNMPFGYSKRRLSVEWSRGERGIQNREGSRSVTNQRPTKTLFVINFDPVHTKIRDIERHFEPYGNVLHVRIRKNFAFVQFETQEEATKALEATHLTKILDRMVSVEYALKDDSERGSPPPRRGSDKRGESPFGRSRSPVYGRARRASPDYGRGRRASPDYGRARRASPDYGRDHSPVYDRYNGPSYNRDCSPDYRYRSRSPIRRSRT